MNFCLVKYIVLRQKSWHGRYFFPLTLSILEGTIFENKFFMLFLIFWKQTTVTISVWKYQWKLDYICYSCFQTKKSKSHYKIDKPFFSSCSTTQLMIAHESKTLNAWILFCKIWIATKSCYYKKLLKANLITSSALVIFSGKRLIIYLHFNFNDYYRN